MKKLISLAVLTVLAFFLSSCDKTISVELITLNYNALNMEEGETRTLVANISPSNATSQEISWSSSDNSIATVDQNGAVNALKAGTASVVASSPDGVSAACAITVKPRPFNAVIIENRSIETKNLAGDKGLYNIMLPENWETSGKKYPVLYLLHGMSDNNTSWSTKCDLKKMTETAVRTGQVGEFIVVMPNAFNSFYVDGIEWIDAQKRNFETYFWTELVPHIESTYPVLTDRTSTAISGLSMGGFGATYYGFTHPEKFCLIYSMSGAVGGIQDRYGSSEHTPSIQTIFETYGYNESNYATLPFYILDCGSTDYTCGSANVWGDMYLNSVKFPHVYRQRKGGHEWSYWADCYTLLMSDLGAFFKPAER